MQHVGGLVCYFRSEPIVGVPEYIVDYRYNCTFFQVRGGKAGE